MKKKALVLAGSKGVGKAICIELKKLGVEVTSTSRKTLDTSDIKQVEIFIEKQKKVNILVLNTGGPPAKDFHDISLEEWKFYFNQLFLSFILFLKAELVKKNGYIILISSILIKEPEEKLALSSSFRLAFSSILKTYSGLSAKNNISCINIALGPIKTQRLMNLVTNIQEFENKLPMKRAGKPSEVGKFITAIIQNDIKYLNGVTINFDGGLSNYVL